MGITESLWWKIYQTTKSRENREGRKGVVCKIHPTTSQRNPHCKNRPNTKTQTHNMPISPTILTLIQNQAQPPDSAYPSAPSSDPPSHLHPQNQPTLKHPNGIKNLSPTNMHLKPLSPLTNAHAMNRDRDLPEIPPGSHIGRDARGVDFHNTQPIRWRRINISSRIHSQSAAEEKGRGEGINKGNRSQEILEYGVRTNDPAAMPKRISVVSAGMVSSKP